MPELLLLATINRMWYLPPLALVISLVYNASRYESPRQILQRGGRLFATILVFMSLVLGVLYVIAP